MSANRHMFPLILILIAAWHAFGLFSRAARP